MDTKKLILAIVLSVTVLLVYQYFFMPKPAAQAPADRPAAAQAQKTDRAAAESKGGAAPDIGSILNQGGTAAARRKSLPLQTVSEDLAAADEQTVTVENAFFTAVFTNRGAGLTSFILKKYKDDARRAHGPGLAQRQGIELLPVLLFLGKDDFSAILNKALFSYRGATTVRNSAVKGRRRSFSNTPTRRGICSAAKNSFSATTVTSSSLEFRGQPRTANRRWPTCR